ncbi:MAG TPA: ATP-binding protein [Actinomycetota bacterium]|nr:ATP-binding protein [Actinomycetota bacterium]
MDEVQVNGERTEGLNAPPPAASWAPFPPAVAQALSHLANLIDASIAVRGVGSGVRDFAATFLGVRPTELVATTTRLAAMAFQLATLAFAEELAAHPPAALIGKDQETPPRWEVLDLGDLRVPVPYSLAGGFAAGTLAPCPLVAFVDDVFDEGEFTFTIYSRAADAATAKAYLDGLIERGRARTNPFKGRVLHAVHDENFGLTFRVVDLPVTERADVVLPASVWEQVDRNVHGFFAALDRLTRAGLARNRGVLLEGPPGTGKTALCRALARELPGTTVIFCDAATIGFGVRALYRQLDHLAPALVVMEDIDLVVGDRRRGGSPQALNNFLLALDGAVSGHAGVVTIATTNDLAAIDPAARRSARFDAVVTVPAPDRRGRAAILSRYLRNVDAEVDVDVVAAHTPGATGADLRELVSRAVLHAADEERRGGAATVTTSLLLGLLDGGGAAARAGPYL